MNEIEPGRVAPRRFATPCEKKVRTEADTVPLSPFVPFVFCLTCTWMLWSSLTYARELSLLGLAPLACGVPLYFVSEARA